MASAFATATVIGSLMAGTPAHAATVGTSDSATQVATARVGAQAYVPCQVVRYSGSYKNPSSIRLGCLNGQWIVQPRAGQRLNTVYRTRKGSPNTLTQYSVRKLSGGRYQIGMVYTRRTDKAHLLVCTVSRITTQSASYAKCVAVRG